MPLDYKQLGFKCGIEIHQQIQSNKLFCNCPSIADDSKPDFIVERRLRVAAGETGEVDVAAAYEFAKKRKIIYQGTKQSACLIELDESPPLEVNHEALETALQVALLLNAHPIDEIQVMRKTITDGSNTSGFQRTMLIATAGYIETSKGRVNIDSICLEEDSAKKVKATKDEITYRLDRLGIPLIEIATDASIKDPEHCKEVATMLGMILRSTERVKRGLGTIRQDVNVSIKGHPRVEIKGFQDLRKMPQIIEYEIQRQQKEKKPQSHVRKAEADLTTSFLRPMPGAQRMYPETDCKPILITKELLKKIKIPELLTEKAIKLEKKYKLSPQLAHELIGNKLFERYIKKFQLNPTFIAKTLVETPKEIASRFNVAKDKIKPQDFETVFKALQEKKINESAVFEILIERAQGKKIDLHKYKAVGTKNLEKEIQELVQKNKNLSPNAIMGMVMKKYKGKVDGKKAMGLIRKYSTS